MTFLIKKALSALVAASLLVVGTLLVASPAQAVACNQATLFASNGSGVLYKYRPDGTAIGSPVTLTQTYFDIAFDSQNGTFYGIRSNGQVDVVNVDTGAILRSVQARTGFYNSGSVLPGGMIAAALGETIVYISPADGTTVDYFDMNLIVDENGTNYASATWGSAGDFITLADGSLLAILNNSSVSNAGNIIVKITNGQGLILGVAPSSWGGARVGSDLFLAGSDGQMRKINSLPTVGGRGNIATTTIATLGSGGYYGAAGTEDSDPSQCSPTGQNGYTPGVDAFNAAVPATPAVAGTAPVVSPASSTTSAAPQLAETGFVGLPIFLGGIALATIGGLSLFLRRSFSKSN